MACLHPPGGGYASRCRTEGGGTLWGEGCRSLLRHAAAGWGQLPGPCCSGLQGISGGGSDGRGGGRRVIRQRRCRAVGGRGRGRGSYAAAAIAVIFSLGAVRCGKAPLRPGSSAVPCCCRRCRCKGHAWRECEDLDVAADQGTDSAPTCRQWISRRDWFWSCRIPVTAGHCIGRTVSEGLAGGRCWASRREPLGIR